MEDEAGDGTDWLVPSSVAVELKLVVLAAPFFSLSLTS